ncbi:MAG: hypothetical protein NTW21_31000 [Verrucomicrobia bacterium]|nr:hypothetical protein [Verrucomicrobiota bacterium]
MNKWLITSFLLVLAVFVGTRSSTLRWLTGRTSAHETREAVVQAAEPRVTKRSDRSKALAVEEFCKRLAVARTKGTEDGVRSSIQHAAGALSSDELLRMIAEVRNASCAGSLGFNIELILVGALANRNPALAADYAVDAFSNNPTAWEFFCGMGLFDGWATKDVNALIAWSDQHRDLFASDKSTIVIGSETAILKILMKSGLANAMARVRSLPNDLALATVGRTFGERPDLLEPDQAIDFLRDALGRKSHEDLVGEICGPQLYRGGRDKLRAFFRQHDATLKEREAIIYQAVNSEVNMGFKGTPREYIEQVRAFANEEGPGITGKLTALILGTVADRDHNDKAAVDMMLEHDPDHASLRVFLKTRGATLDGKQRQRIAERLGSEPDSP